MILSFCGTRNTIILLFLIQLDLEQRNIYTNAHLLDSIQTTKFDNHIKNIADENSILLENSDFQQYKKSQWNITKTGYAVNLKKTSLRNLGGSAAAPVDAHGPAAEHKGSQGSADAHADDHGGHHDTLDVDIVLFLFMCLLVGQHLKQFASLTGIPYTSMITVLGLLLGIYSKKLDRLGKAIDAWSSMSPQLLLLIFLPALIFESAFNSDWHIFRVEFWQVIVLAGPMLLVAVFLTALMMKFILFYGGEFTFVSGLLYGSIASATDPVAVVCLLKELGASKRLSTMIEGESLLNDGTAMVAFLVMLDIAEGADVTVGSIIVKFIRLAFGGPILGLVFAVVTSFILKRLHNNYVLEMNTTLFSSYLIFFLAENTVIHVSGILAIVTLGFYMTATGKTRISAESEHAVHHVWSYIGFAAETMIFMITGLVMGQRATAPDSQIVPLDYLKLVGTYIILHIIRFGCFLLFWPCLSRMGFGLNFKQLLLCSYAGLRGAVGMCLALFVAASNKIPRYVQDIVLLHVLGLALLTLIINATTTGWVVRKLGLSQQTDLQKNLVMGLTIQMDKNIDSNIEELKLKHHFNQVEWRSLRESVRLSELKRELKEFKNLQLLGDNSQNALGALSNLNQLVNVKIGQNGGVNPQNEQFIHLGKMESLDTFKGQKINQHEQQREFQMTSEQDYSHENASDLGKSQNYYVNREKKEKQRIANSTNIEDLIVELRHRYLTILKACYWHFFEEGQCMSESVIVLMESADTCMDDETQHIKDWDVIKGFIVSDWWLNLFTRLSQMPYIGWFFRGQLFDHFSVSYDILVNFIEAHEEASHMIQTLIENKNFVDIILSEAQKNVDQAESYMKHHIEEMFPEICKAVQQRRAQYYLLVHEANFVDELLKHGQIEGKEAAQLRAEIDQKIYQLSTTRPDIPLVSQSHRIVFYSELSEIFERDELLRAIEAIPLTEEILQPNTKISSKRDSRATEKLYYIVRGELIEKVGDLDSKNNQISHKRGSIGWLQNLLPLKDSEEPFTQLYCTPSSIVSVIPFDLKYLSNILVEDQQKLKKLWQILAQRYINLNLDNIPELQDISAEKMKIFCKICNIEIYKSGDIVNLTSGGILLRGTLFSQNDKPQANRTQSITIKKNTISPQRATERDNSPRSQSIEMSVMTDRSNLDRTTERRLIGNNTSTEQKMDQHKFGKLAKSMAQNHSGLKLDNYLYYNAVEYFKPDQESKEYRAKGKDMIVVLHLGKHFANHIVNFINDELVDRTYRDYQYEHQRSTAIQELKMLGLTSEIAKTRSHMTFNVQNRKQNILDLFGLNQPVVEEKEDLRKPHVPFMGYQEKQGVPEKEDERNSQIPPPAVAEKVELRKPQVPSLNLRGATIDRMESEAGIISENALAEYSKVITKMNGGVGMKQMKGPTQQRIEKNGVKDLTKINEGDDLDDTENDDVQDEDHANNQEMSQVNKKREKEKKFEGHH